MMKLFLTILVFFLSAPLFAQAPASSVSQVVVRQAGEDISTTLDERSSTLNSNNVVTLTVIGQGVAPESTISPYQSVALAKKAAIADAYRMLAEKLNGVKVEGFDIVKNMVIQKTQVKTCVSSMIKHANIVETKCAKDFCEVEMELKVVGNRWYSELVAAYK